MGELHENTGPPTIHTLDCRIQYHSGDKHQHSYKGHKMTAILTPTSEPGQIPHSQPPTTLSSPQTIHNLPTHLHVQIQPPHLSQQHMGYSQAQGAQMYSSHGVCMHQRQYSLPTPSPTSSASAKRPSNSWILYRKEKHPQVLAQNPDISNNEISKIVAKMWKSEPESVKDKYKLQAQIERNMHRQLYPDYKYAPRKNKVRRNRWAAPKSTPVGSNNSQQFPDPATQNPGRQKVLPHPIVPQWQSPSTTQVPHAVYQQQPVSPQNYQMHQHDNFGELGYLFNPYQSPIVSDTVMRPVKQVQHNAQQKNYYYVHQQYIQQQQNQQTTTPISPIPNKMFLNPTQYRHNDLLSPNDLPPASPQHNDLPLNQQKFQPYPQAQDIKPKDCHVYSQQHLCSSPTTADFLQQQ